MKYFILLFSLCLIVGCNHDDKALYAFNDPDTNLWGFKTQTGKIIIKPQYNLLSEPNTEKPFFKNTTYHFVFKGLDFFAIDKQGNKLFEGYFFDNGPDYFEEGLARYIEKHKVGFHDKQGNKVLPAVYEWARPFYQSVSIVCNGCYGERGDTKLYAASSWRSNYITEAYTSIKGGKWGAINKQGDLIIPLKYDSLKEVENAIKEKNLES